MTNSRSPVSVSWMLCPCRQKSSTPNRPSSAFTWVVMLGCPTKRARAAAVKLPCCATAWKQRSWWKLIFKSGAGASCLRPFAHRRDFVLDPAPESADIGTILVALRADQIIGDIRGTRDVEQAHEIARSELFHHMGGAGKCDTETVHCGLERHVGVGETGAFLQLHAGKSRHRKP